MLQPESMASAMNAASHARHVRNDEVKEGPSLISGPPSRGSIANPPTGAGTAGAPLEFRTHELALPAGLAGLRLDQALAKVFPQYSRARLQGWIRAGAVRIDWHIPRSSDVVRGDEAVEIKAALPAS